MQLFAENPKNIIDVDLLYSLFKKNIFSYLCFHVKKYVQCDEIKFHHYVNDHIFSMLNQSERFVVLYLDLLKTIF